jgi:hypothetical protein
MFKFILNFVFLFNLIMFPYFTNAADTYRTGRGLVPRCNIGNIVGTDYENSCDFDDFMEIINRLINFVLFVLATPLFAILIMYAGFLYMFDGGNSKNVSQAKSIFKNALWGYVIALVAWLVVKTILVSLGFNGTMFLTFINSNLFI